MVFQGRNVYQSAIFSSQFQTSDGETYHKRIMLKNGRCNFSHTQTKREKVHIIEILKLVDYSWWVTIILFTSILVLTWFSFGVLYWAICFIHGDFEPQHLPPYQKENKYVPCIYEVYNYESCFLFSLETQHTIGYGIKATTEECPEAIFLNAIHCLVGYAMQGIMAAIIFYKMTLPTQRQKTLLFSKNAVICPRGEKLCIAFRIGDTRRNDIVAIRIRAFFIRTVHTLEGEKLAKHQTELKLVSENNNKELFFHWPLEIFHVIDKYSPLYYFSPKDFANDRFEIIVVLEGTNESTGQMTQYRTSYMAQEIMWGRKFEPLLKLNKYKREYEVDLSKFDRLLAISTPLCSAAYCEEFDGLKNIQFNTISPNFTPGQTIGENDKKTITKQAKLI